MEIIPKELVHSDQELQEKLARKEKEERLAIIREVFGKHSDEVTPEQIHEFTESFVQKAYYFSKLNKRQVAKLINAIMEEVKSISPIDKSVRTLTCLSFTFELPSFPFLSFHPSLFDASIIHLFDAFIISFTLEFHFI